tara:strand:- start:720 stop:1427 length:708 start_codon:yes stop_codon:yes gene_type:complete
MTVRWVKGGRGLVRFVAVGSTALFLTSLNPLGVILAPEILNGTSLVAVFSIALALIFDVIVPAAGKRLWPALRLLVGLPAAVFALVWSAFTSGLPGVVNRVSAPDGQQYLLGVGPTPTDVTYQLWRSVGSGGLLWEQAEVLTWSEDGRFTEDPKLVLVHERWLMVRRGGIWTDCYEITPAALESCGGGYQMQDWRKPDAWRAASDAMVLKTGATPTDIQTVPGHRRLPGADGPAR